MPEEDDDAAVDFDAGVREPVPLPSDPGADHNEVVSELLSARQVTRGAWGWDVE
jgi:hypothetical protein